MKQVWMARDGKLFDTESECVEYEKGLYCPQLLALIIHNVEKEYNPDTECEEITPYNVAELIIENIHEILAILRCGGRIIN